MNNSVIKTAFFITVLAAMFAACSLVMTKEKYIADYTAFMNEIEANRDSYTEQIWVQKDKLFEKYSGELYKKFESKLTAREKYDLAKNAVEYTVYRNKDLALDIFSDILDGGKKIQNELSDFINEFTSKLEDAGNELGKELE